MKVYWVDASNPGSYHDWYVLENSRIYTMFENGDPLVHVYADCLVMGDSAYPHFKKWLITPFPGKKENIC